MKINQAGIELVKSFEGFRAESYLLEGENYYTIGYGHSFDSSITSETVWTKEQATEQLKKDLARFEDYVTKYAKEYGFAFNENQFSALVSYCYNRGAGGLKQLLSNSDKISHIANNMIVYWGSATRYKNGLIRRRKAEKELFLKPVPKPKPAPTPKSNIISHKVVKGESLALIAHAYKTTVERILKINPTIKNPNLIYPKQLIKVPDNR